MPLSAPFNILVKKMNIAAALKEKNRLTQKILRLHHRIDQANRVDAIDPNPPDNVNTLILETKSLIHELGDLKRKIATATHPVADLISKQVELKKLLKVIKDLKTSVTPEKMGYSEDAPVKNFKVQLNSVTKNTVAEDLITQIDTIQDQLDKFNAVTTI